MSRGIKVSESIPHPGEADKRQCGEVPHTFHTNA